MCELQMTHKLSKNQKSFLVKVLSDLLLKYMDKIHKNDKSFPMIPISS